MKRTLMKLLCKVTFPQLWEDYKSWEEWVYWYQKAWQDTAELYQALGCLVKK